MIKQNKKLILLTSLVTLLPMILGLCLWNQFPEQIPIHWNVNGEVDSWGSKIFSVVFLPMLLLAIHWFCIIVTASDPNHKDIIGKPLYLVLWVCPVMSILVCSLVYVTALGLPLSVETLIPLVLGGMFIVIGNYLPKCKKNYTIGIKVSWALDDEENWNATHRFAGKIWVIGGAVIMVTGLFGRIVLVFTVTFIMTLIPILYSYIFYRRKNQK